MLKLPTSMDEPVKVQKQRRDENTKENPAAEKSL